jgi:uncharacterized membrane protein YgdD (TMEM256/DUF423 family)
LRNLEHLEGRNVVYKLINIAIGSCVFVGQLCVRKLSKKRANEGHPIKNLALVDI